MNNKKYIKRSVKSVWHPCTQMKHHEDLPLIPIEKGKGTCLYDFDGKKYLDVTSSWWVNLFGHNNKIIKKYITLLSQQTWSLFCEKARSRRFKKS